MNEKMSEVWLRQAKHIRVHLWYRYFLAINQVMIMLVRKDKQWSTNFICDNPGYMTGIFGFQT